MTTDPKIDKLPQWAQTAFRHLQMERDAAVRDLKKWRDNQTPSSIYIDEMVCDGEQPGPAFYRRYIQGYQVSFGHGGVHLDVMLLGKGDGGGERINLKWSRTSRMVGEVAMIPESFQQVRLQTTLE